MSIARNAALAGLVTISVRDKHGRMRRTTRAAPFLVACALVITACAVRPTSVSWSDPFTSLSPAWHEVDPLGDGHPSASGGTLHLAIPSGLDRLHRDHDNWPDKSPVNRSLRVTRSPGTSSTSWTFTTKILNTDTNDGRFAGALVQASADHYFRSDWDGDGSHVRLYVGTWDGGPSFVKRYDHDTGSAKAQWQRITRRGTSYTVSWSLDGATWLPLVSFTWKPTPTVVGLNVGNSGTAPAYIALFDVATLTSP